MDKGANDALITYIHYGLLASTCGLTFPMMNPLTAQSFVQHLLDLVVAVALNGAIRAPNLSLPLQEVTCPLHVLPHHLPRRKHAWESLAPIEAVTEVDDICRLPLHDR